MQQFEINNYIKKQITEYLEAKQCDLQIAMNDEQMNREFAAFAQRFPDYGTKILFIEKI